MPLGEFELIRRYFTAAGAARADVLLGVGDDGAILAPPPGQQLIAVVDTLVEARISCEVRRRDPLAIVRWP